MKEIVKNSVSVFLRLIVINIMCFFVVISFTVISTALFSKNVGYKAFATSSDSSQETKLYEYYYSQGEDQKKGEYEKQGIKIREEKIRSDISSTGEVVNVVVTQIFCIMILTAFVYPSIWQIGTKDSNLVKFKHKSEDRAKGFKIGAFAIIPSALFSIFMGVAKAGVLPKFPVVLYKFINSYFYGLIDVILGKTAAISDVSWWKLVILLLLNVIVVLICGFAYILGYKNYSISEKLIYKKK